MKIIIVILVIKWLTIIFKKIIELYYILLGFYLILKNGANIVAIKFPIFVKNVIYTREKIYGDWTGENLYYFWTSSSNLTINGAAAVDSLYDEIKDYDFSKGDSKNGGVVGHFTQLVWKGTSQLGMGVANQVRILFLLLLIIILEEISIRKKKLMSFLLK